MASPMAVLMLASSTLANSVRYNASSHVAIGSSGCGKSSPYTLGKTTVATGTYAGVKWTYRIYVPKAYKSTTPLPLLIHHPGWGMSAASEESGAGITALSDTYGFISVTAQGGDDNSNRGGPWYSWNAVGTTQSPGPGGYTCTKKANYPEYCYTSCDGCGNHNPQCDWTTCEETGPTPTGTGLSNVGGFIPSLYDTLESQLCVDTSREYASGESNGGMMTYQLGVDLATRLAAISPEFGSFHKGFAMAPAVGVPVIDLHGTKDTTVPANVSLSADGYYYTTTDEIFGGNQYSRGWMTSNGCKGSSSHYPTKWDGQQGMYCVSMGDCPGGDVVRCSWNGGHNWLLNSATANGPFVLDFLFQWTKPAHLGYGYTSAADGVRGEPRIALLGDVTIVGTTEIGVPHPDESSITAQAAFAALDSTLSAVVEGPIRQLHYGNPKHGCRADEEVVEAGTGTVCAPKMGINDDKSPKCLVGGAAPSANSCPTDAAVSVHSKAWPVCVGKGAHEEMDPYDEGLFHCLLVCPCTGALDDMSSQDCGPVAHAHCPSGARCEMGELRNRAQGVCTYV